MHHNDESLFAMLAISTSAEVLYEPLISNEIFIGLTSLALAFMFYSDSLAFLH